MAVSMAIFFCVAVAVTILLTVAVFVAFHFSLLCVPFLVTVTVPHVSE